MSQALSFQDADHFGARPVRPHMTRSGNPRVERATLRRRAAQAATRVPMLDWPSDLFSDNATLAELVQVDFLMQCNEPTLAYRPRGHDSTAYAMA